MQAQEFKKVQEEFSDYMDRLQEDIALKAEKFGHVEFYDARLQDGYSNSMAVAASEVQNLDERRKPLAVTNPLLAKESVLLPEPNVEEVTYEHLSLNLPSIAVNALDAVSRIAVESQAAEDEIPDLPEDDEDEVPDLPEDDEECPDLPDDEACEEDDEEYEDEEDCEDEEDDEEYDDEEDYEDDEDEIPDLPEDDEDDKKDNE